MYIRGCESWEFLGVKDTTDFQKEEKLQVLQDVLLKTISD